MIATRLWSSSQRFSRSPLSKVFHFSFLLLVFLLVLFAEQRATRAEAALPEMPRAYIDTSMPSMTGRVISVPAGGDFQAALNEAQYGDIIELQAGASYVGMFSLPNKGGSGWIVVRSSNWASLPPEGARVRPEHAALMPKLLSPGDGLKSLTAAQGAHHYRFIGIEFAPIDSSADVRNLIWLGEGNESSVEQMPHHIILDRVYVHGFSDSQQTRGVCFNGREMALINSYVSEIHHPWQDSQAVWGAWGPGPYLVENNYLEAAGENVMFGGDDPRIEGLIPSDIVIRRNHVMKPWRWREGHESYDGRQWVVKNLLEIKNGQRVLIEGNLFENSWKDEQTGVALLLKGTTQYGRAPWSACQDVVVRHNIIRRVGTAIQLGKENISQGTRRVQIVNNLAYDLNREKYAPVTMEGCFVGTTIDADDVTIEHNTVVDASNKVTRLGDDNYNDHRGLSVRNNLFMRGMMGWGLENITTEGVWAFNSWGADWVYEGNLLFGGSVDTTVSGRYPLGNFFSTSGAQEIFADYGGGNYRLRADSPYRGRGTDGRDLGCDIDTLEATMASTTPPPPSPTPAPTPKATPTPTPQPTPPTNPNLPLYWDERDIGNTALAGSGRFEGGVMTVNGSGMDISTRHDGFHFVYRTLDGDGEIVARVASMQKVNSSAKAGVMVRENLTSSSRHAMMNVTDASGTEFLRRRIVEDDTAYTWGGAFRAPYWVKLVRRGDSFSGYLSADGVNWQLVGTDSVGMARNVYIGLAVTSHDNSHLCAVTFDHVTVNGLALPPAPSSMPTGSAASLVSGALATATTLASTPGATSTHAGALVVQIEQAHAAFMLEAAKYASADQIERNLLAALYFARAAAALAATQSSPAAVQSRLHIAAVRLSQANALMSQSSGMFAPAFVAETPVIGAADTRSSATLTPVLSPSSLGTISGDASQSPLASQEVYAKRIADGSLPFELAGASVSVGGRAAMLVSVSPSRIAFNVPAGLPAGETEIIVTSEQGYVSRGTINIAPVAPGIFTLSGGGTGEAIVLNAATYLAGMTDATTESLLTAQRQTRLMLFATGVRSAANSDTSNDVLLPNGARLANVAESVTVEARMRDGRTFMLPVEYAGAQETLPGLDQLTVRIVPELRGAGSVELVVTVGGRRGNTVNVNVR
ncbi:MAG TPA: hypothetical protein VGB73_03275 [Pyrinomonadaceae bacterium]|jgi:uncharacterized protein (TIGR03437 family)